MINNNSKNYYFHTTSAGKVSSIYQHPLKKGGQYMDTLRYNGCYRITDTLEYLTKNITILF